MFDLLQTLVFGICSIIVVTLVLYALLKNKEKSPYEFIQTYEPYPLVLHIENLSDKPQKMVLFGYNKFSFSKNYGSDLDVSIKLNNATYNELLMQSAFIPFDVGAIRFVSENINELNLDFKYSSKDCNGMELSKNFSIPKSPNDSLNYSVVQLPIKISINSMSRIETVLPPRVKFQMVLLIERKYELEGMLRSFGVPFPEGLETVNTYANRSSKPYVFKDINRK